MSSFKSSSGFSSGVPLGIALLLPLQLFGAEQPAQPSPQSDSQAAQSSVPQTSTSSVPPTSKSDKYDYLEGPRDYLSGKVTRFANNIDRFFGGDRYYQESNQSVIQFDLTKQNGYAGDGDRTIKLGGRVNLRLPETEGRLHMLLESTPENNITDEPTPNLDLGAKGSTLTNKVAVPGSVGVAVRYQATEENFWHFNTDWGVKFPLPPRPFVRSMGSFSAPLGEWRMKTMESVYWFNTLGAGETTQVDLERKLSEPVMLRATSISTWLNNTQNFDMRQDFSIYHTLDDRTALLYQASAVGITNPQHQMTDLFVLMLYRYRMQMQWLFFEISPQLHFPRERQYRASPAINLHLEMLLDDSR